MIVHSIHVKDFLSHADSEVTFGEAPLWLICGENGAGKSALFDALEYALYGQHRGKKQSPHLLVRKGGTGQFAIIDVVFELGGDRYHLVHRISRRDGNLGGQLARWDGVNWQVVNVGPGKRATWGFLKRRLPDHELFRSAIFLRQGETDRFLQGTAEDRVRRFAALIDLARYSRLAAAAGRREREARDRRLGAERARDELGDTSGAALKQVREVLEQSARALDATTRRAAAAAIVTRGARAWCELRAAEAKLAERRQHVETLLADAAEIREAATRVARWDRAVAALDAHRRERQRVRQSRQDASDARVQAKNLRTEAGQKRVTLVDSERRCRELIDEELPAARKGADDAEARERALGLEREITVARVEAEAAHQVVEGLAGADDELTSWQVRQAELPRLDALWRATDASAKASLKVHGARDALSTAQREHTRASEARDTAREQEELARTAADDVGASVRLLEQDIARLQGQITARGQLEGDVDTCPVCARPLDSAAHGHVQTVLAGERASLFAMDQELSRAQAVVLEAATVHQQAVARLEERTREANGLATTLALAQRELDHASADARRADEALAAERRAANAACPMYADQLDDLTATWLSDERTRVAQAVRDATSQSKELAGAREILMARTATLSVLHGRRVPGTDPCGDNESPEVLASRYKEARAAVHLARVKAATLEDEHRQLQVSVTALTGEVATLEARAMAADERVSRADQDAASAEAEAMRIADQLGETWCKVLDTDEAYDAEQEEVEALRETSGRLAELDHVDDEQSAIDRDAAALAKKAMGLDPSHERPVEDAEADERSAREAERTAAEKHGGAQQMLKELERKRTQADALATEIDATATDQETYGYLADILKDGGQLQVNLAKHEQRRISEEVNGVLEGLGDTLRVSLGDPRRTTAIDLDDIHVLDTSDPSGEPRFFEFLSGGEQFRVALALALALHRRVGKQAGTLILDEGFGALDSGRRYALAEKLTETTDAILDRGLAHSIIICSHSEEVQRQFPHRWHVRKHGDAATVTREDAGDVESAALADFPEPSALDTPPQMVTT